MARSAPDDRVRFVRPSRLEGVELAAATYRDRTFPVHTHPGYVIGVVTGGAEALSARGRTRTVAVGDVIHLNPLEPHANRSLGQTPLRYRMFYLAEAAVARASGEHRAPVFARPVRRDPALAARLAAIHRALAVAGDDLLAQEDALAALLAALRPLPRESSPESVAHRGVDRARGWIDAHFTQDFGLGELAAVSGLSTYRLAHLFKARVGLSPIAYRTQRRIDAARGLLLDGEPIADIALRLGFADQSHLTRQFQKLVGVSPQRYRQQ